jgi:tetratricopeptide (TPR) repeat protein
MSLSLELTQELTKSDTFKNYITSNITPLSSIIASIGMAGVTPFLSPLIIGGLSTILLPQAFKFAGKKIQVANNKIQEYKQQGGVKGLLASIASPCLSVLSKCIPPDTDLHAILTDSKKLHQFFNDLLNNKQKRKEFEESLEKFLTGKYKSSNEFLATIKEAFGLDDVGVALDAYAKFTGLIYNKEILEKVSSFAGFDGQTKDSIDEQITNFQKQLIKHFQIMGSEIEKSLRDELLRNELLNANLSVIAIRPTIEANADCWKDGIFGDAEVLHDYDARRPVVDNILNLIDASSGTILFGKSHYGKSTILSRIKFEAIDRGYVVIHCSDLTGNVNKVTDLLSRVSHSFPKLLVILDDVHKQANHDIFSVFNRFYDPYLGHIRFLFSARKEEFNKMIENLDDRNKAGEIVVALRRLKKSEMLLGFGIVDAIFFVKKALTITYTNIHTDDAVSLALNLYKMSNGDPFTFMIGLRRRLFKTESIEEDFVKIEMNERINKLNTLNERKTAILCSLMGALDIHLSIERLRSCNVDEGDLIPLVGKSFLLKNGEYKVRHELWALEFLIHFYKREFNNDALGFTRKYQVDEMIGCICSNSNVNEIVEILNKCRVLYTEQSTMPLAELIATNIKFPDKFTNFDAAELFYSLAKGSEGTTGEKRVQELYKTALKIHESSIKQLEVALEKDQQNKPIIQSVLSYFWFRTGNIYGKLGNRSEAIRCYDKSLEYENKDRTWVSKGMIYIYLDKNEALNCFNKALRIDPNNSHAWNNKGIMLSALKISQNEALECLEKALKIKPDYPEAYINKGTVLSVMERYEDAIAAFEIAFWLSPTHISKMCDAMLNTNPNHAPALFIKGHSHFYAGEYERSIEYYEKVERLFPNYIPNIIAKGVAYAKAHWFDDAIRSIDRASDLAPNNPNILMNKGVLLDDINCYEQALECYDKALNLDPNDPTIWYNRACCKVQKGEIENGLSDLSKAIQLGGEAMVHNAIMDKSLKDIERDSRFLELIKTNIS